MVNSEGTPEYRVGLRMSCRIDRETNQPKYGLAWEILRFIGRQEGSWKDSEVILTSPDVFDCEDDAKRDAVRTLKSLPCCDASPLRIAFRTTIGWMVDES